MIYCTQSISEILENNLNLPDSSHCNVRPPKSLKTPCQYIPLRKLGIAAGILKENKYIPKSVSHASCHVNAPNANGHTIQIRYETILAVTNTVRFSAEGLSSLMNI